MNPTIEPKVVQFEALEPVPTSKRPRKIRVSLTSKKAPVVRKSSGRATRSRKRVSTNARKSVNSKIISVKAKPCRCDVIGCKYAGAREDHLKRHMKVHKHVFTCTSCDKKFMTQKLLTDHEPEHDDKCKFLCSAAVDGIDSESRDIHEESCPKYNPTAGKVQNQ